MQPLLTEIYPIPFWDGSICLCKNQVRIYSYYYIGFIAQYKTPLIMIILRPFTRYSSYNLSTKLTW